MKIYFDTSFLVSLYARDANSSRAIAVVPAGALKMITQFGELEFGNALQQRVFRRQMKEAEARLIWGDFQRDLGERVFQYHPFNADWLARAMLLSRNHTAVLGVRTLDLVHVASALELEAEALFTFDNAQRALAKALRMRIN